MTPLVVATTNAHKLKEIRALLAGAPVEVMGLDQFPTVAEPEETGATFVENARLKARYYGSHTGLLTMAEDSGLVIDGLGGEPGIRSARFVAPGATYEARFAEIYRRLADVPLPHQARFVCALAVVRGPDIQFETTGLVEGHIAVKPSGTAGFGYDPMFYYPPYGRTLADVSEVDKLKVAHRGQAIRAMRAWLSRADRFSAS